MEPIAEDQTIDQLCQTIQAEANLTAKASAALRALARKLNETDSPPSLWDIRDVAEYLNVSKRTVETLIDEGEITPIWVKGQRRFDPGTIDAYLRRQVGQ